MNDIEKMLSEPLDKRHVKPPAPGRFGDYIEGHHAIREANRIFGHLGWSYSLDDLREVWRGEVELKDRSGNPYMQARASFQATVTVSAHGVTKQDVGHGHGQGKPQNWGDVIESAAKEAATDALKRALRAFGDPFGLALYDKTRAHVADVEAERAEKERRAELEWKRDTILASLVDLPDDEIESWPKIWAKEINSLKVPAPDLFDQVRKEFQLHKIRAADRVTSKGANAA